MPMPLSAQEPAKATAPTPVKPVGPVKEGGEFIEGRHGDIPEGAAEQITPETDHAIEQGLAWLAKTQNADGSFGSGNL